jgi:hypothetical protein
MREKRGVTRVCDLHDRLGMNKNPRRGERNRSEDPTLRDLRAAHRRSDDGDAFVPDPLKERSDLRPADDAESFGEEFITSATTGNSIGEDARDEVADEEVGGPFIELESEREQREEEEAAVVTPRVLVPRVPHRHGA